MPDGNKFPHLLLLQEALVRGDLATVRTALLDLESYEREALEQLIGSNTVNSLLRSARRRRRAKRGRVVVINGIMGAKLDAVERQADPERIWVNYLRLFFGRISDLKLTKDGQPGKPDLSIRVAGLMENYLAIMLELDADWHVLPYPFDWRMDIYRSAQLLDEQIRNWSKGEPVHIVAHSMGGLVSRCFIDGFKETWAGMADANGLRRGGRLIMLGTPNKGSYAIPLIFSGVEKMVKLLEAVDIKHSLKDIQKIVSTFPGCYQMLPSPLVNLGDDHAQLFESRWWGSHPIDQDLLGKGKDFQTAMEGVVDPDRMIYVAGFDQETPCRIRINSPGSFSYQHTLDGDGRVPHDLGLLPGVPVFWVREQHGDLPKNDQVLSGIHGLLETGATDELLIQKPSRRSIAVHDKWLSPEELEEKLERESPNSAELVLLQDKLNKAKSDKRRLANKHPRPVLTEEESRRLYGILLEDYLGVALVQRSTKAVKSSSGNRPNVRQDLRLHLDVEVIWGDITLASGDIYCVGHYEGVLPVAAEAALDRMVSGHDVPENKRVLWGLTKRGILRGSLGDIHFYPWSGRNARGRLVAIAGMGRPGSFSSVDLRELGHHLSYAIGSLGNAKTVCSVLIGSGNGGLSVKVALDCLLRGMDDALRQGLIGSVRRLRIVEKELGKAMQIMTALNDLKQQDDLFIDLRAARELRTGNNGIIATEFASSLTLAAAASALNASAGSKRKQAMQTLLQGLPVDATRRKSVSDQIESLGRSDNRLLGIMENASRLTVCDGPEDDESGRNLTRISFARESDAVYVAAIGKSAVVPRRRLAAAFSLVTQLNGLTTDPDPKDVPELSEILHERLIPQDFVQCLKTAKPLIVEVDREMAEVNWEFLSDNREVSVDDPSKNIVALRTQLARQLRTSYSPPPTPQPVVDTVIRALVIGDPGDPESGDNLPGAREEAMVVARLLERRGVVVDLRIGAALGKKRGKVSGIQPATLLEVLHLMSRNRYDLLHYAGHGDFDPGNPSRVGWVFKDGLLTPAELENMPHMPLLVVANACLSGRTSNTYASSSRSRHGGPEAGLIASLADEFFRRGVFNYIGTAWEIDDEGAILFADQLYSTFFSNHGQSGETLGTSLCNARKALYRKQNRFGSLWAAYQHYGDPDFRLRSVQ